MDNIIKRICCFVVGWNYNILKECGEASYKTLKRYMAAIIILSIIWGTIGWCIASDHLHFHNSFYKAIVAAVFILIVICIERFIILSVGGLGMAKAFRIALALLMAVLGSTIFDQIIFRQDVLVKMKEVRTEQVNNEVPKRLLLIEEDINKASFLLDSLRQANSALYEEIAKKPTYTSFQVTSQWVQVGTDEWGNPIMEEKRSVNKKDMENPLINQAKENETTLQRYYDQISELQAKRLLVEDEVRKEYGQAGIGFLEELSALYSILLTTPVALGFYIFLFLFLSFLEMLVVTTKSGMKCDYELIIEHQLAVKKEMLKNNEARLSR